MGKSKKDKGPVVVPHQDDMDDETFMLHLEKRHAADTKVERLNRHAVPQWIGAYRAFHNRLHAIGLPGQYEHDHDQPEDEIEEIQE